MSRLGSLSMFYKPQSWSRGFFGLVFAAVGAAAAGWASGPCPWVSISQSTGAVIVPGTTDINNHTDDSPTTTGALPFPVMLYGVSYTPMQACSNGFLTFTTTNTDYTNICLPSSAQGVALMPHWDDLMTNGTG